MQSQNVAIQNFNEFVMLAGNRVVTDSRAVAKAFGKRHTNVLRSFDRLDCSEEFRQLNFEPRDYLDGRGKKWRMIEMTKDGFMFLVMGFTGKAAAAIKEAFIKAFNAMAEYIQKQSRGLWDQMNALTLEYLADKKTASFYGKGLRRWRDAKRELEAQIEDLRARIQPPLFLLN